MNAMIQLSNLTIGYHQGRQGDIEVATSLNGSLARGELICLLGSNGEGKSTLLRTLAAFQPSLSGEVLLLGKSVSSYTQKELSRVVSVVLTEKPSVEHLTVEDIVGMGRSPYTGFWGRLSAEDKIMVNKAMEQVGIGHLCGRSFQTLSDGERQKVMIAKALAQHTPIILLDEPTSYLDYPSKVHTLRTLRNLAHDLQKTIFLSTHDVELALQLADRIWLMHDGQLTAGSPRQLATDGALERFLCEDGICLDRASMTLRLTNLEE